MALTPSIANATDAASVLRLNSCSTSTFLPARMIRLPVTLTPPAQRKHDASFRYDVRLRVSHRHRGEGAEQAPYGRLHDWADLGDRSRLKQTDACLREYRGTLQRRIVSLRKIQEAQTEQEQCNERRRQRHQAVRRQHSCANQRRDDARSDEQHDEPQRRRPSLALALPRTLCELGRGRVQCRRADQHCEGDAPETHGRRSRRAAPGCNTAQLWRTSPVRSARTPDRSKPNAGALRNDGADANCTSATTTTRSSAGYASVISFVDMRSVWR